MSKFKYTSFTSDVMQAIKSAEKRTLSGIGVFVEGEAINRTPVGQYDDGRVGGNLRSSITHKVADDHVVVGTNTEYAVKCMPSLIAI